MRLPIAFATMTLLSFLSVIPAGGEVLTRAPAGERYVERDPNGETVLPNGRLIRPIGKMLRVRPHPYGLTMSADGRWVVAVSSDGPQLSIVDMADVESPKISFIPDNVESGKGVLDSAFMGLAIAPDNRTLYVAGGNDWSVTAFDLETRERLFRIDCAHEADPKGKDTTFYRHGYLGDLRLSRNGKMLYAVDQSNFRMLVIDVSKRAVVRSIPVGRYPFGIALSHDGHKAFVANVGMFEYSYLKDQEGKPAFLPFPPFGVPSKEAAEGLVISGVVAQGLGDPNDLRGMSVWALDVAHRGRENVTAKVKTGHLVGEPLEDFPAVGGSSPNSMVVAHGHVYVSNGSNDSISVIDVRSGKREADIDLYLHREVRKLRGMIPFGLALSPDQQTLYVAEAGISAIGVVRLRDRSVRGHIPTAWFPSKLAVSPDGKRLYVACAKGIGSGPNAGPNHAPDEPTGIGDLMRGYINIIPTPNTDDELDSLTREVVRCNVVLTPRAEDRRPEGHPVPPVPGAWKSPIKHIIYVAKENRTYDEVFGALPGGRGDVETCRLGRPIAVSNKDGSRTIKDVVLMPNHMALAKRFAINDNFYCDSDHSVDGHRWLVGTYPNEFMEAKIGEDAAGEGPGNFAFIGSSGAIYPEDYNEAGAIWEHFERNDVRFFNFGLGFEFKPQDESQEDWYTGIKQRVNYPMPKPLFDNTSRRYATYNTNIPDQFRMDMFEEDLKGKWLSGKEPFPQVITIMLPNDHGAGERPEDGYPFWGSFMSDNDLALGRLVGLISHSPWWKETVIFVTEDDAQGYRDSVDAHRSICMVISPYAKRDHVSHVHSSFGSILKTMFLILGIPSLNQYDGLSTDLAEMLDSVPANLEPYEVVPVNAEVFDPDKALDPFDRDFNWEKVNEYVPLDDQPFLDTDEYGHSGPSGHAPRKEIRQTP